MREKRKEWTGFDVKMTDREYECFTGCLEQISTMMVDGYWLDDGRTTLMDFDEGLIGLEKADALSDRLKKLIAYLSDVVEDYDRARDEYSLPRYKEDEK